MLPAATPVAPSHLGRAADLLRALGNEHRLAIMLLVRHEARCVHELVDALGMSQPLVSQHLRVLRTGGLVTGERRGRETAYSLADEHVARIVDDTITHVTERERP